MQSGPKPKPTRLKILAGNPGKRPLNKQEPKPPAGKLPVAPPHLNRIAKKEWRRLAKDLHSCGVLTQVDTAVLGAYCQAYSRWVQAEDAIAEMAKRDQLTNGLMIKTTNGNAIQNPLVGTSNKSANDMVRYAAELGMTPSARSRVTATETKSTNAFSDI